MFIVALDYKKGEVKEMIEEAITESYEDIDKFYVDKENEIIEWVYFNPDSSAGGQFVYNKFDFDTVRTALYADNPLDYISEHCKQYLIDVGSSEFEGAKKGFLANNETFTNIQTDVLNELKQVVECQEQKDEYIFEDDMEL